MQADGYREPDAITPRRWRHIRRHGHDLKLTRERPSPWSSSGR